MRRQQVLHPKGMRITRHSPLALPPWPAESASSLDTHSWRLPPLLDRSRS